jgi:zeaxanthin glucosyltransferase
MGHVGLICPNVPGHLNPMLALADAIRRRGHRATFFLLGDVPELVAAAGIEVVPLGGSIFPPDEYRTAMQRLGTLEGRAALSHTLAMAARSAEAILGAGPAAARAIGITALLVDQASFPGGTVADELGVPFATVCNALLSNPDPAVPPFFTHWKPQDAWWARLRNRVAWAGLDRLYSPVLVRIQERRRQLGLPVPERIAEVWSSRLQISQQPQSFEFPRQALPKQVRFVGPLRLSDGYPPVPPFPWDRLDGRRLVYASLGTLQNRIAGTFRMIAEACDGLDVQLVISTGHGVPMASLGDLPGRPVVVPYAPQLELLRRAALAVTHAGLNTTLDALSTGLPMVAIPVTNEQPGIAARIAWVGSGETVMLSRVTPRRLHSLISRVLSDPSYAAAARRVRDAIQAAAGALGAADMIEQGLGLRT